MKKIIFIICIILIMISAYAMGKKPKEDAKNIEITKETEVQKENEQINREEKTAPDLPALTTGKNYPTDEQIENQIKTIVLPELKSSKYYPSLEDLKGKNNYEQTELCQIPEEILYESSTEHLLILCLEYPLYKDMVVYNSMQWGYAEKSKHFNGIQELYKRDDIIPIIIDKYYHCNNDSLITHSYTIRTIDLLARIISQNEILDKCDYSEIKDLLEYTFEHKRLNGAIKFYLLGKLLAYSKDNSFSNELSTNSLLNSFIIKGSFGHYKVYETIKEICSDYLNEEEIK